MKKTDVQFLEEEIERHIEDIRGLLWTDYRKSGRTWPQLAEDAGVCYSTMRNFANGGTKRPGFATIAKLASAMGYRIAFLHEDAPAPNAEMLFKGHRRYVGTFGRGKTK